MNVVSLALIAFGALITAFNWSVPLRYYSRRRTGQSMSLIPIVGGVSASVGGYVADVELLRAYSWLPLFLDIGCLPMVLFALWNVARKN